MNNNLMRIHVSPSINFHRLSTFPTIFIEQISKSAFREDNVEEVIFQKIDPRKERKQNSCRDRYLST